MASDPVHPRLSAELEAGLVRELKKCWDHVNWLRFGEQLKAPVIVMGESERMLGQWRRDTRTIEIGRMLVLQRPWPAVVAVIEHEMAHQYVDEVLGVRGEPPHGETFQRVCRERGIDARAAGEPIVRPAAASAADVAGPQPGVDRLLDRIRKLFALAGSSNQHEAEAAMARAHELMLRHSIESLPLEREFEVRHLGDPGKRRTGVESEVAGLLAEMFFVEVIRIPVYLPKAGAHGQIYEIVGTTPNVEMASHVWAFLLATAERLWRDNRTDARVRSGRERIAYQTGVVRGFREKLLLERVALTGTGLVWRGDVKLEAFYRSRNPRIVSRRRTMRASGAHHAGREAGRTVVLHKPVTAGATAAGSRLLPD